MPHSFLHLFHSLFGSKTLQVSPTTVSRNRSLAWWLVVEQYEVKVVDFPGNGWKFQIFYLKPLTTSSWLLNFLILALAFFKKSSDFNKNVTGNTSITEIYWTHTHTHPFKTLTHKIINHNQISKYCNIWWLQEVTGHIKPLKIRFPVMKPTPSSNRSICLNHHVWPQSTSLQAWSTATVCLRDACVGRVPHQTNSSIVRIHAQISR